MSVDNSVTSEGKRLVEAWTNATMRRTRKAEELAVCYINERDTEAALAAWLAPSDIKPGEKISVWYGDSLIQVEWGGVAEGVNPCHISSTRVTVRTRGKHGRESGL